MADQICGHCKKAFPLDSYPPSHRGRRGTWCRDCYAARRRGDLVTTTPHEERSCDICGILFRPKRLGSEAEHYCSPACNTSAQNAKAARARVLSKPVDRICRHCGASIPQAKTLKAFYCSRKCMSAAGNQAKTPEQRRIEGIWANYKMTPEMYDELVLQQGGVCAICGEANPQGKYGFWAIDHCHATGTVRGLLCGLCNRALGQFGDRPNVLDQAVAYLERAKARTDA